jgi:hypothetical protein
VACVAIHTVVHISADVWVIELSCVVATMAAGAGEHGVIRGISVAGSADPIGVAMVEREKCVISRW